jgi:hypothetical protein
MKLYLRRSVSVSVPVSTAPASFLLNPESLVAPLLAHPLYGPPAAIASGTITPFFPTGGWRVGGNPGIRIQTASAILPIKCNYYRVNAYANNYNTASSSPRNVTNYPMLYKMIKGTIVSDPSLSQQLGVYSVQTSKNIPFNDQILNVTPGGSQVVETSSISEDSTNDWNLAISRVGYPGANNNNPSSNALETFYVANNAWDLPAFKVAVVSATLDFGAASCEYYEIEFDASAIGSVASALTDIYIIVPVVLTGVNPLALPTSGYSINTQNKTITSSTSAIREAIIPLSQILAANGVVELSQNTPSTGAQVAINSVVNGFEANYSAIISMSSNPFTETLVLEPPITTGARNA